MEKPRMKTTIGIEKYSLEDGVIYFYSSEEDSKKFKEFGDLWTTSAEHRYRLVVDKRYSFSEVQSICNRLTLHL